ncbi:S8 family serine peptidase [Rhizobium alvei]|uniref:S8 family serine peptidase n=1 Tax=Rhizobium alvei TaxID=1132659 RepID=A0ABT8YH00_9HYPH|nr:S8 family serine peptidase [Rhizobium alvei]MDO6962956.1 S8 family serine peptidase [Rhizobium alvei]
MALPSDPLLSQQWHLGNSVAGLLDLNVRKVWNPGEGPGYTGAGIRVFVIDDGFDYLHSDLSPNYRTDLDFDYADATTDPFGLSTDAHGTAVTGIIGAAANGTGAVGVAYGATLVGYRVDGFITNTWLDHIGDAITSAAASAAGGDVINISQGIANDLSSEFRNGYNAAMFTDIETAIGSAVDGGRGGLGTVIVKSAGNSRGASIGATDDYDVNADDWTNDTRQVVVAAVDQDGFVSSYSSYGAAVLVSGFGTPGEVVTTDRRGSAGYTNGNFTTTFNGTSSAAPMVSGVVALMLDANDDLGWRDVQNILASSARHVGSTIGSVHSGSEFFDWGWNSASTWNGGGMHFSNDYGYGLVDALAAVRMSETWLYGTNDAQKSANQVATFMDLVNSSQLIPDGNSVGSTFSGTTSFNDIVERVTVTMTFSTTFLADMEVYLTSPDGTTSQLIADQASGGDFNGTWTFESQAFRGERSFGNWSVKVVDDTGGDTLTITDLVIRTWGDDATDDRYIYTDNYSDYDGVSGHVRNVVDSNGGSSDVVNASAVTTASVIRLNGNAGRIDGVSTIFTNIENAVGGDGKDTIVGSAGVNKLFGMRGADEITGGGGNDEIQGGIGFDTIRGGVGADKINGGGGTDTATYADAGAMVVVHLDNTGSNQGESTGDTFNLIENLTGSAFGDKLFGDTNDNRISGGNGNDLIVGGDGVDTLLGGANTDTFQFGSHETGKTKASADIIMDFSRSQSDKIDLHLIDAKQGASGNNAFTFIGDRNFHNVAGELRTDRSGGDTFIYGDMNGDGNADMIIRLDDSIVLRGGDFIL